MLRGRNSNIYSQVLLEKYLQKSILLYIYVDEVIFTDSVYYRQNCRLFEDLVNNLIPKIPNNIIKVAESGISSRSDVEYARDNGADAVLIGEALVRGSDPGTTLRAFLGQG